MTEQQWSDFALELTELKTKHGISSIFICAHDERDNRLDYAPCFSEGVAHPLMIDLTFYVSGWMQEHTGELPSVTVEEFLIVTNTNKL